MKHSIDKLRIIADHYQRNGHVITSASLTHIIIELTKTEADYKERIMKLEYYLKELTITKEHINN